jgi:hypothetical protein
MARQKLFDFFDFIRPPVFLVIDWTNSEGIAIQAGSEAGEH